MPEAEAAHGLLLRGRVLHLFEVDAWVLQLYLEMLFLRVRVLSEGLRARPRGYCHYQCEHWRYWQQRRECSNAQSKGKGSSAQRHGRTAA